MPTATAQFGTSPGPFQTLTVPMEYRPMWWHTAGRTFTASGYGRRIPSPRVVKINGRWRRVYVCIFSNSGTAYVEDRSAGKRIPEGGKVARYPWIIIHD